MANHPRKVTVFAPASIGNVNVGFDILGAAIQPINGDLLGDIVSVEPHHEDCLTVVGEFADKLPSDQTNNIVWQCLYLFNQALINEGRNTQKLKLILDKKMPVGSGLGSSACSVVAAITALNEYYLVNETFSFSTHKMLLMMGEMEAQISGSLHYDNVAPCYFGGMQLMVPDQQKICQGLPVFDDCYYVMAYPGIEVSTKMAREVLPSQYDRRDVIAFGQNLATFVDACHRQDKQQAFAVVKDILAEPYRAPLLPRFIKMHNYLTEQGCLAVGISGSGPTLFCVTDDLAKAQHFQQWLSDHYLQSTIDGDCQGFVHICKIDTQGARVVQ